MIGRNHKNKEIYRLCQLTLLYYYFIREHFIGNSCCMTPCWWCLSSGLHLICQLLFPKWINKKKANVFFVYFICSCTSFICNLGSLKLTYLRKSENKIFDYTLPTSQLFALILLTCDSWASSSSCCSFLYLDRWVLACSSCRGVKTLFNIHIM